MSLKHSGLDPAYLCASLHGFRDDSIELGRNPNKELAYLDELVIRLKNAEKN